MAFSNPRRTAPVTCPDTDGSNGLRLKTNLTLRKGATFHYPPSPPSSPPTSTFKVPSLPRRSQTSLDDVIDSHRRRVMMTLGHIEDTLSSKPETSAPRRSFRDESLPVPTGFLDHTVAETLSQEPGTMETEQETERRVLRPRHRRSSRHHESDSGLGTSVASKQSRPKETKPSATASTITRSATSINSEKMPRLSQRAVNRIHEHTLRPLLAKPSLKDFEPIILDCPRRIQENQIVCLRDLEKTLIFMAPERAKSAELYLDFCLTSIRCIQATVEYLSDREQTRPHDRPYNNGYFIDLVEQIRQHAQQMQSARERQAAGEELDDMDVDPTDEVKLMGGIASTGRPAELVRVKKNGKAISIATGQPIEDLDEETKAPIRFKRSMSEQLEDEEEIMRSMARRKKNADPSEYAPKKCKEPGCNKEFKRPCDLTKHEKTHSRPWKCPLSTCKYHEYGWPTEKEMDRHINDKHSAAPPMYECLFKPCPYKSKRESNCKQHMEKAHGWTYVRTKTNKKGGSEKGSSSSAKPTPMIPGIPTPSSEGTSMMTPPDEPLIQYPDLHISNYASPEEFNASFENPVLFDTVLDPVTFDTDISLEYSPIENGTPSTDAGQFTSYNELSPEITGQFEDIYGAHVQLPTPTHSVYDCNKVADVFTTTFADEPVAAPVAHISPVGHGNTMLYTPSSLADVDEGFDEFATDDFSSGNFGNDFLLFPPKPDEFDANLFLTTPSAAAGFSQPSSQDFNMDFGHAMDWTSTDYSAFQPQN